MRTIRNRWVSRTEHENRRAKPNQPGGYSSGGDYWTNDLALYDRAFSGTDVIAVYVPSLMTGLWADVILRIEDMTERHTRV